ncbi:MAG: hypothetical protein KJ767_03665 [Nanoarchaeota archaeon]|nr:hypothetical protein [Nanoarchaeota archaeon]
MRTKYILLFGLILGLLAFGQAGCQFGGDSQAQVIGLDFSLNSEAPPSMIEPNTEFQIVSTIENYGDTATNGDFCVEDTIDDSYGGIDRRCLPFSVRAASKQDNKILPGKQIVVLPSEYSSFYYRDIQSQQANIIASIIYDYSTIASPIICVKDPLKQSIIPCSSSETVLVDVKAPLDVTKVEKNIFRASEGLVKLRVKIYLKKQIKGDILPSKYSDDEINKAELIGVRFANTALDCDTKDGYVEIGETETILRCEGYVNVEGVIKHPLNIWLDYSVQTKKVYPLKIEGIN